MWVIAEIDSDPLLQRQLEKSGYGVKKARGRLLVMLTQSQSGLQGDRAVFGYAQPPELPELKVSQIRLYLAERQGTHDATHCPYGVVIGDHNGRPLERAPFPFMELINHRPDQTYFTHPDEMMSIWAIAQDMDQTFTLAAFCYQVSVSKGCVFVTRSTWGRFPANRLREHVTSPELRAAFTAARNKSTCPGCRHVHYCA